MNSNYEIAAYNLSMFKLRYNYPKVFNHHWLNEENRKQDALMNGGKDNESKQNQIKICYKLNILCAVSQDDG